jgi:hypothetical protein
MPIDELQLQEDLCRRRLLILVEIIFLIINLIYFRTYTSIEPTLEKQIDLQRDSVLGTSFHE